MKKDTIKNPEVLLDVKPIYIRVVAMCLFFLAAALHAQDVMLFKDGSEIKAKVLEIGETEITYKDHGVSNGPLRVVAKATVFMIRYENGTKEIINGGINKTPATTSNVQPVQVNNYQKFGGPRVGLTFITPGTLSTRLSDQGKSPLITQFGWQFEKRMFNFDKGPCGMIEFVPLIGGMDQGLFLPSASLLVGLRGGTANGFEVAAGPVVSVTGLGVVIAFGKNFKYKNVNFPVNIAYVPSVSSREEGYDSAGNSKSEIVKTGHRISLLVGFNMRKQ